MRTRGIGLLSRWIQRRTIGSCAAKQHRGHETSCTLIAYYTGVDAFAALGTNESIFTYDTIGIGSRNRPRIFVERHGSDSYHIFDRAGIAVYHVGHVYSKGIQLCLHGFTQTRHFRQGYRGPPSYIGEQQSEAILRKHSTSKTKPSWCRRCPMQHSAISRCFPPLFAACWARPKASH